MHSDCIIVSAQLPSNLCLVHNSQKKLKVEHLTFFNELDVISYICFMTHTLILDISLD